MQDATEKEIIVLDFPLAKGQAPPEGRIVFLDRLLLPAPLDRLSISQIEFINRFRERHIETDPQFQHLQDIRRVIAQVLAAVGITSLLEIGCGKFPFSQEMPLTEYAGVEVDQEAVRHCQELGLNVGSPLDRQFVSGLGDFACCLALYVFHFAFEETEIDSIAKALLPGGLVFYNVVGDDAGRSAYRSFGQRGFGGHYIVGGSLSRKERVFVLSRPDGRSLAAKALELTRRSLSAELGSDA